MKVGFFLDVYDTYISGMVESVKNLKLALEKEGNTVYIIIPNGNSKIKKYLNEKNIIKIPSTKTNINDFKLRLTYPKKCEKIIENLNLDIIHSHTEFTIGRFGKSMAKKLNIPFIQTFHTKYDDVLNYITKGHLNKITNIFISKLISSYYNDKIINEIIVPTKKIKKLLLDNYKIKNNINIVPTGIDLDKFSNVNKEVLNKKINLKKEDFIILWVGRIGYEKNIEFLIDSHFLISNIYPNIKLLIVGTGPLEEELKYKVKQNKKENSIIFLGKVSHDIINNYYQMSNIFVTSSTSETQGLTVIESLSSGLPVLCIKCDVFKEIIKNGYNGYLFNNKNDYINKVLYLYKNNDKLNKLKQNTISSVNKYSLSNFANNILKVYNKAIYNNKAN